MESLIGSPFLLPAAPAAEGRFLPIFHPSFSQSSLKNPSKIRSFWGEEVETRHLPIFLPSYLKGEIKVEKMMEGRMEGRMEESAKERIEEFAKGHGEIPDFGNRVGKSWEVKSKKSRDLGIFWESSFPNLFGSWEEKHKIGDFGTKVGKSWEPQKGVIVCGKRTLRDDA